MPYSPPIDWKNDPDHSTPLTAANIKAMEAALAAYSESLSGGGVDASTTVKGIAKLSVAPASPSNPISVGSNDTRVVADQAAGTASIRTLGTGSQQAAAGNHGHVPGDITGLATNIYTKVKSVLVAGTNVTLTPNDGAETITIAASGSGSGIATTLVDAKGDLVGATADNTPARVPAPTADGQVLTALASASTGLTWAAPSGGGFITAIGDTNTIDLTVTGSTLIGVVPTTANLQVNTLSIGSGSPGTNLFYIRSGTTDVAILTDLTTPALKLLMDGVTAGLRLGSTPSKVYPSTSPFAGEVRVEYPGTGSAPTTTAFGVNNTTTGGDVSLSMYENSTWKAALTYKGTQDSLWLYVNQPNEKVAIVHNGAWDSSVAGNYRKFEMLASSFTGADNGSRGTFTRGQGGTKFVTLDNACGSDASYYCQTSMVATFGSAGSLAHYYINGTQEEARAALAISSLVTSAGSIRVNTTLPHNLVSGETVFISGSQANANGFWIITIDGTSPTTSFVLNGSTFAATGTGTALPLTYSEDTGIQDTRTFNSYGTLGEGIEINHTYNVIGRRNGILVGIREGSTYANYANLKVLGTGNTGTGPSGPGSYFNAGSIAYHASANNVTNTAGTPYREVGTGFLFSNSTIYAGFKRYMVIRDELLTDQFVIGKHATVVNGSGIGVAAMAFGTTINQTTNFNGLPACLVLSPGTSQPTTQEYGIQFGLVDESFVHRAAPGGMGVTGKHTLGSGVTWGTGLSGSLVLTPQYTTVGTAGIVSTHNYLKLANATTGGGQLVNTSITDACALFFDAAPNTHKAVATGTAAAVFTANSGIASHTALAGWFKINVNGTVRYVPYW